MPRSCAVPKCRTGYKSCTDKVATFKIPNDESRKKQWENAIGISLKPTHHICEKHFEDHLIFRKYIGRNTNGQIIAEVPYQRPKLSKTAIPTVAIIPVASTTIKMETDLTPQPEIIYLRESHYVEEENHCAEEDHCYSRATPPVRLFDLKGSCSDADGNAVILPDAWSMTKSEANNTSYFTFTCIIMRPSPVVQRHIMMNREGTLQYFILGKEIETQLPKKLEEIKQLPEILQDFLDVKICAGIQPQKNDVINLKTTCKDQLGDWRHKMCTLMSSDSSRCELCVRAKRTAAQMKWRKERHPEYKEVVNNSFMLVNRTAQNNAMEDSHCRVLNCVKQEKRVNAVDSRKWQYEKLDNGMAQLEDVDIKEEVLEEEY